MLENSNHIPNKDELVRQIQALIDGTATRESVSSWAEQWIALPNPPDMDDSIWELLVTLAGADLRIDNVNYLHGKEDIYKWMKEAESL